MNKFVLGAASALAMIVAAAPASAAVYVENLGAITVPPDQIRGSTTITEFGAVSIYYNFNLMADLTLTGGSFTSTQPAPVQFSDVSIYRGRLTATETPSGTPVLTNTGQVVDPQTGATSISFSPVTLASGRYSVVVNGTATAMNGVGSIFRFSTPATAAVPEPATWGMLLLGFGMIGAGVRSRRRSTKVTFA